MSVNPVSTYRIQFHREFSFDDFEKIIPYLKQLGVKAIYASPVFESTPGSTHGYDGTNPNAINPELGSEEQLSRISNELKKQGMLWIQDIVPNHLAFHENNSWLMDVLAKGQSSPYAAYFDIIWDHPEFGGRLMVPFPGSPLEEKLNKELPDQQHYVVRPWQETDKKINYRRFFLVNGLICTNVQDEKVFDHYHALIKKLSDARIFDGVRVDHVDGLYDPVKYLHDLRHLVGDDSYIIVEKILGATENMPGDWPIQGNSGYDFLAMVNNVFTCRHAEYELTTLYYDITDDNMPIEEQVKEKKRYILQNHMQGELDNLTRLYHECGLANDESEDSIKSMIADYLVSCPVYRFYGDDVPLMERDKNKSGEGIRKFYNRCMQFTGPLMAKGVEDTLMYTYNRFIGHNEVGDSPEYFGHTIDQFHELMKYRQQNWPHSLNGSSTHDTKRGEDVRARLNAVTCFHDEWAKLVRQCMESNSGKKINGIPDNNDEYLIYQTLVGSFPMLDRANDYSNEEDNYLERLQEYLQKALREAKVHSNWAEPNTAYEQGCFDFTRSILGQGSSFRNSFIPFVKKITDYGIINSLAQLVLKFMCPGIPDIYQGTELWDLSLVDPDNRRPVDYSVRLKMLTGSKSMDELWNTRWSGEIKLSLLQKLLSIRNEFTEILTSGEYIPVSMDKPFKDHVLAFMRKLGRNAIMIVVPVHYALVENQRQHFQQAIEASIPENLLKRELLNFSDFFKIIHLDLVA